MINSILLYIGSGIVILWGAAHLVFTGGVVKGFKLKSVDDRRVLTMEWITEGLALCFIGALVAIETFVAGPATPGAVVVSWGSAAMLVVMAVVSLFTGARVKFIAYRLCPPIFLAAALLFFLGGLL
jgi:hypothetical protein